MNIACAWNVNPDTPFEELYARFIVETATEIDPDTRTLWELYGGTHFAPHFDTLGKFTLAESATYARKRLGQVRRVTVNKELSVLRRFAAWAKEQNYATAAVEIPKLSPKATGTPYRVRRRGAATELDLDEVRALIDALPEWSVSKKTARFPVRSRFIVAHETSLRPASISALSVPENYVRGEDVLILTDENDKARFGRELPLSDEARAALDSVCPEEGVIFGKHDYRDQLRKAAKAVLSPKKAKTFTGYDFRHARLTQLAETGNLTGAAYLAGHKNVSTTDKYVRPNRKAAERALTAVGPTGYARRGPNPATKKNRLAGAANNSKSKEECEGEDLNLHGSYPTSTSS